MLRHEFHPGRLIAGVTGLVVATVYGGDAAGAWDTPWYAAVPLLLCGLVPAAVATRAGRRRHAAGVAPADDAGAPTGGGDHAPG